MPANLGIIPGNVSSGWCVRDFDNLQACGQWKPKYREQARRLPAYRTNRGVHVLFRYDEPQEFWDRLGTWKLACGDGELLMGRCIATVAPSKTGGRWRSWLRRIEECPTPRVPDVDYLVEWGVLPARVLREKRPSLQETHANNGNIYRAPVAAAKPESVKVTSLDPNTCKSEGGLQARDPLQTYNTFFCNQFAKRSVGLLTSGQIVHIKDEQFRAGRAP